MAVRVQRSPTPEEMQTQREVQVGSLHHRVVTFPINLSQELADLSRKIAQLEKECPNDQSLPSLKNKYLSLRKRVQEQVDAQVEYAVKMQKALERKL